MKTLLSLVFACTLLFPVFASAYDKNFMVELHMGASFPDESMGDIDLDAGFTFGTSISYNFLNDLLGVYIDIGSDGYDAESASNFRVESVLLTGFGVGMTHQGSFPGGRFGYFVRLGLHSSEIAILDDDDDEVDETRSEIGLQTSGGVRFNLSDTWALRGGLRYKTYSNDLRANSNIDASLDSLALIFGASFRF